MNGCTIATVVFATSIITVVFAVPTNLNRIVRSRCHIGDACWPTVGDIAKLRDELEPASQRILKWDGIDEPRPCSVPINSEMEQPLYGAGVFGLEALYTNTSSLEGCYEDDTETRPVCIMSTRNNPMFQMQPAFVVWALTAEHVQAAVRFAVDHELCVMVLGTGHDFLNRHSCDNGVLIRTTLMQQIEWDLDDRKGFGWRDGNVKLGAGHTFSTVSKSASANRRFVSQGWAITVGVVGWSIGGGHGPFANYAGLGVDNILEVEVVSADGKIVVANAKQNSDLWWALRGGGGSTWGVITSITLRAHTFPSDDRFPLTVYQAMWSGGMCEEGKHNLHLVIDELMRWQQTLDNQWSGLAFVDPSVSVLFCGAQWEVFVFYRFVDTRARGEAVWNTLISRTPSTISNEATPYSSQWDLVKDYGLEPIIPVPWLEPQQQLENGRTSQTPLKQQQRQQQQHHYKQRQQQQRRRRQQQQRQQQQQQQRRNIISRGGGAAALLGGVPSVLVSRDTVANGKLAVMLKEKLELCNLYLGEQSNCQRHEFYHDITGNVDAVQEPDVSISPWFRTALFHYVFGQWNTTTSEQFYALGDNSYMSESAFDMSHWQYRLWGENYDRLVEIKQKYDPDNVFWCHHCVGDDSV